MWVSTQNCCPWATFCISFEMYDNLVCCAGYFCTLAIALLGYSNNSNKCWLWRWSWTFTKIWNQTHCSIHSVSVYPITLSCMLQHTYMLQRFQGKCYFPTKFLCINVTVIAVQWSMIWCSVFSSWPCTDTHTKIHKNTNTQKIEIHKYKMCYYKAVQCVCWLAVHWQRD